MRLGNSAILIIDAQGESLVSLARRAVQTYLDNSVIIEAPDGIGLQAGVFVTLSYLTSNKVEHLRGCIGFPQAHKKLPGAVIDAAIAAATTDPRFPPVDRSELQNILFELSVLTPPVEQVGGVERWKKGIKIGRDGLILTWRYGSGLLLPQVPLELNWNVDEYLSNLCYKAGAPLDALSDPSARLYSFQALVFRELEPAGRISRVQL